MSRSSNRCEACDRAHAQVPGGKCAMHETSTSPIVERSRTIADRFPGPGWSGPFLGALCGYDPFAPVPTFDEDGRRVADKQRRRPTLKARKLEELDGPFYTVDMPLDFDEVGT